MVRELWEIVQRDPLVQLAIAFALGTWIALFLHWREGRGKNGR